MKRFMRRDHADTLKRQFMNINLEDNIAVGLYNRQSLLHKAFSSLSESQDQPMFPLVLAVQNSRRAGKAAS